MWVFLVRQALDTARGGSKSPGEGEWRLPAPSMGFIPMLHCCMIGFPSQKLLLSFTSQCQHSHLNIWVTQACPLCQPENPAALLLASEEGVWRRSHCPVSSKSVDTELHLLWFHWQPCNLCRYVKHKELKWQEEQGFMASGGISISPKVQTCEYKLTYAWLCPSGSSSSNLPCCFKQTKVCGLVSISANDSDDLSFFPHSPWRYGFVWTLN